MALQGLRKRLRRKNSRSSGREGLQRLQQPGVEFNSMSPRRAAQVASRAGFNVTAKGIIDARAKMANTNLQQQNRSNTPLDAAKLQELQKQQLKSRAAQLNKGVVQGQKSKVTPLMQQKLVEQANAKAAQKNNKAKLSDVPDVGTAAAQAQTQTKTAGKPNANMARTQTQGMAKGGYTQRWAEARKKNK